MVKALKKNSRLIKSHFVSNPKRAAAEFTLR